MFWKCNTIYFLKKLLDIYFPVTEADFNMIKNIDIIKKFLNTNEMLYDGVEFIMHVISAAYVAISVEFIVESIVSMYENRQTKFRNLGEDRANHEMQIGCNGPNLAKDRLLEKAMNSYFKTHKENGTLPLTIAGTA